MKATIESTTEVVQVSDRMGGQAMARVWEGITEGGVRFTAYITQLQVRSDADRGEFARDLQEHKQPSPETVRAIDLRFVI